MRLAHQLAALAAAAAGLLGPLGIPAAAAPAATRAPPAAERRATAVLETSQGVIVIALRADAAPRTVANFEALVAAGFFDGTYFHRVVPGFVIQGGDPHTRNQDPSDDGRGGPATTVPAEIGLPHLRGAVAARFDDRVNPERASHGSQFFIDLAPQPSLDRAGYTVFGEVVEGMEVIDRIAALAWVPGTAKGAAGPNPGREALIRRTRLEALAPRATAGGRTRTEPSRPVATD